MIRDPSQQTDHETRDARLNEAARQFRTREISEAVYRATLFGLGVRGRDITTEVHLNWPER